MSSTEITKRCFKYLIDAYGFFVDRERNYPDAMGNADVVFKSKITAIKVVVDRSQVLLNIGKVTWPEREWFEFSDVIHHFYPNMKEVYDFTEGSLKNQTSIEAQARHLSLILRQYCGPLLNGDFSMQDQIKEIEKKRVNEMIEQFGKLSDDYRRTG